MVGKIYSQLEYLTAEQAASYLCFLIDVKADIAIDALVDYANQRVLWFYCLFDPDALVALLDRASLEHGVGEKSTFFEPIQYQCHSRGLILKNDQGKVFAYIKNIHEVIEFEGSGAVYYPDGRMEVVYPERRWVTDGFLLTNEDRGSVEKNRQAAKGEILLNAEVFFSVAELDDLAAQINGKANAEVQLASEQQELEVLKAEVERLQVENAQLKVGASVSDEISPREKESLYKIIAAMAIDGYGHNLEAKTNGTVQDIVSASTRVGIPIPERTIRKHLSAALDVLPAKPIKT